MESGGPGRGTCNADRLGRSGVRAGGRPDGPCGCCARAAQGRAARRLQDTTALAYYQFVVTCLDRETGAVRWQRVAREVVPHEGRHSTNTYASASPTTDGRRLYVSFGSQGIFCYDLDGEHVGP